MTEHSVPMHVLIVGDDPVFKDAVASYLDGHDMRVAMASSHQAAMPELLSGKPSMVILDLHTGKENGLDLLREIHARQDVAVITTGCGHSEMDRVVALEMGADDHLTKPFSLRELLARIRGILRRREIGGPALSSVPGRIIIGSVAGNSIKALGA